MRNKRQTATLALLAFFCVWQTSTVLHFLITPHEVCEHGKVVDGEVEGEDHESDSHDDEDSDHEDCFFLTFLTSPRTLASDDASIETVADAVQDELTIPYNAIVLLHGEEVYSLSPSNSPPAIS
ncbi:MAG: hypothetical protein GY854_12480 [Deltaproteobacteria bacterium]|nr:hypothetical protein [Deltaproteobacteria bacterium]